ncbi:MAG: thioredoxin family protein, partial [Ginsengibacter sp.]
MKKILLLITITTVIFLMAAKNPEPKEGLNFFEGTWKEAVQKARDENKPIFLDIYATWCGPCKM